MDQLAPLRRIRGMMSQVAAGLGKSRGAIAQWERVPAELVPEVERISGIPRHELRPDLWEPPAEHPAPSQASAAA